MNYSVPRVTLTHPSGKTTQDVSVNDVAGYIAEGWTFTDGSAPSYTLRPPENPPAAVTRHIANNGRVYDMYDDTIDTRKNATISDPAEYADIEGLLSAGWKLV